MRQSCISVVLCCENFKFIPKTQNVWLVSQVTSNQVKGKFAKWRIRTVAHQL